MAGITAWLRSVILHFLKIMTSSRWQVHAIGGFFFFEWFVPVELCNYSVFEAKGQFVFCVSINLFREIVIVFSSACQLSRILNSKTQQNIERMTFAFTWCANIFVGCSVTPTFFFGRSLPFLTLSIIIKKKKKICTWEGLIISHILFK